MWSNRAVDRLRAVAAAFASATLVTASLSAQASVGSARTVLAAVVNSLGRPVVDVGPDDFVVSEGSESRDVLDVHVADYPIALVVDDRLQTNVPIEALRRAAVRFVGRMGERPVTLVRLSDGSRPVVTLDEDRAVLLERLSILATTDVASTPPLDTISRAANLLKDTGAPFSAVIVIAAGPVDATALVRGELLPMILESGAAVHVVRVQAALEGAAGDEPREDLLRVIADQTKGQFTAIFSPASFDAALDRLADRLAIEMMVQYLVPPGPKAGDVRVGVRIPGSRVIGLGVK
jgi:hypothetical protein